MSLSLCYTALSPFSRKVRMAMEYKGLAFALIQTDNLTKLPAWNPRAEVPLLIDDETIVCNSPDILAYLDRRFPDRPLYPARARDYAEVREWERLADTFIDAIVTVIGNWRFAELPPMPAGLMAAARRDIGIVYDRLQSRLASRPYICGEISAADYAVYPHIASGAALDLKFDPGRHADVLRWLKAMRARPEGQSDLAAVRDWWANRDQRDVDAQRVNWGTYRLEWLLANGQADWFADQVRRDKVLWSVGPKNNALNIAAAPDWARAAYGRAERSQRSVAGE
jgi:glutathione S-transferase